MDYISSFDSIVSRIIYEEKSFLVVNKHCGEAVEGTEIDLTRILTEKKGGEIFPTHRLDVPVSGLTLFARTPKALASLNDAFSKRVVKKLYWAVVEKPSVDFPESGELVHWIKTDKKSNKSTAFTEKVPNSKEAILRYSVIGSGDNYIFIKINLISGRHHQIRAQFANIGLHIKGDLKYGAKRSEKLGGIRLHCYELSFPNPEKRGETVALSASPPIYDNLWQAFEKMYCKNVL